MNYYSQVRELEDKLAKVLAEHKLLYKFQTDKYPITLTVKQNQAPDAQMELYAMNDGSISSQDSVLKFIFKLDEIEVQTNSRLVMTDALMSKIKGIGKKLRDAYCHAYFADRRNSERVKNEGAVGVTPGATGGSTTASSFNEFYDADQEESGTDEE